jgi:hypothetical protein
MIGRPQPRRVPGLACRALLVPAAALVVHQLRFALAFGALTDAQLARTGHSYLHSLAPWIVLLVGIAAGGFLWSLGRALAGQRTLPRYTLSLGALWLMCTALLVAIYAGQEFLEGVLSHGHPTGAVGIFGYGGWWSIPAAAAVGLVLAAVMHGARWALEIAGRLAIGRSTPRTAVPSAPRPAPAPQARLIPLAAGWSDRGPPC